MPLTCPVCGAVNETGPACRRCRADLTLCFAVEARREQALAGARDAAAEGRVKDAIDFAEAAANLRRAPDAAELLATMHLLAGDYEAALRFHRAGSSA